MPVPIIGGGGFRRELPARRLAAAEGGVVDDEAPLQWRPRRLAHRRGACQPRPLATAARTGN